MIPVFLCLFLLTGMSFNVLAAAGGFRVHEAEPQSGDLYAGHFLKKEYAQSRISHIGNGSDHRWITLEGNIPEINQDKTYPFRDPTGQIVLEISADTSTRMVIKSMRHKWYGSLDS